MSYLLFRVGGGWVDGRIKVEIRLTSALVWVELRLSLAIRKTKNDLRTKKQILNDMSPLTLGGWPLQRALKVWDNLWTKIQAEKGPPPKNWKNECVLKWLLGKIQFFKPILLLLLLFF